jgi:alkaline phosphatase D
MKIKLTIFFLLALSLTCFSQKQYVVVVSMDGFRWDYPVIYKTPNLNKIAHEGVKAKSLIPSFPSVTFPNHYSIATGLYPDHHGLVHNNFYDSTLQCSYSIGNRKVVEDKRFYGGEPIWNTAEKNGIKTASFFWVGSEAPVNNMQPTYWKSYDSNVSYVSRIDTVISWLKKPEDTRPQLVMLYFSEPDHTGHKYGPKSTETKKVVEQMDSLIGVLVKKLKKTPANKNTSLIIVSDHGMGEISEQRNVALDKYVSKDWVSQVEGSNPFYMIKPAGDFEDSIVNSLKNIEHIKVWKKHEIPAYLNYGTNDRIFPVVVLADSAYSISWGSRKAQNGGAHGYDIRNTDMHGIFYAKGPSFKKNYKQASFKNVELYNLMASLLNIDPARNDGDINTIVNMRKKNKTEKAYLTTCLDK